MLTLAGAPAAAAAAGGLRESLASAGLEYRGSRDLKIVVDKAWEGEEGAGTRRVVAADSTFTLRIATERLAGDATAASRLQELKTRFLAQFAGDIGYPGMITRRDEVPQALQPRSTATADGRPAWIAPATARLTYGAGAPDLAPLKALISWRLCPGSGAVVQLELFGPAAGFDERTALAEEARFDCLRPEDPAPFDPGPALSKAREESDAGRYARAADETAVLLAEARRRLPPGDARWAKVVRKHAIYARMAGRLREAESDLELLAEVRPPNRATLLEGSRILRQLDRPERALELAKRAVELAPEDAQTLGAEGEAYVALGRYAEAARDFEAAVKLGPQVYWFKIELAKTYRLAGRFEEAANLYKDARESSPREAIGYYEAGYSRLYSGDREAASENFAAVVSSQPGNPIAHHHYGAFLYQMGRYEDSRKEFEETVRLFRKAGRTSGADYAHALDWLARLDAREGRSEESLANMSEARDATVPYSKMWAGSLVGIAAQLKDPKSLDRALDDCAGFAECSEAVEAILRMGRASILMGSDRPGEADAARARADLDVVLSFVRERRFGDIPECVYAIGMSQQATSILERMGDFRKAEAAGLLGMAATACAPDEYASQMLRMELAGLYRRCGERERAAVLWRDALNAYQALNNVEGAASARAMLADDGPPPQAGPPCGLAGPPK